MGTSPAFAASFDEQRAAMVGTVATQSEPAILALLEAGIAEGKAVPAIAEAQKWLAQNRPEQALVFYHAGRAAELSGDWKGAVSLYQQYLADADLKSDTADEAVYAVYTLLIGRLGDTAGAYAFGKNEGNRLLVCPRARQFDQWFLDEAGRRNDPASVAQRLLACIEAGLPDDLLVAHYDGYFRWLVSRLETNLKAAPRMGDGLLQTCRQLAGVTAFGDELTLRLDWAASVLFYNQSKLAGKAVDPPLAQARALLSAYPQYALHVQEGWLGGSRSLRPGSVDDLSKFWPHAVDAKMGVVIESIRKMDADQQATFFKSWHPNYYNDTHGNRWEPSLDQVNVVRDFLDANPDLMNRRHGPLLLSKQWRNLSPEEAQELAPHLKNSTHPEASVIRAIAVGGKDLDAVIKALTGPEFWRFSSAGQLSGRSSYVDPLWHYCGKPGGSDKRDAVMEEAGKAFEQAVKGDPEPKDPAQKRVAAFKALWADYQSASPKEPNGYGRASRILLFSPELVPELLSDDSPETQMLLREAIASGMSDADGLLERDEGVKGLNPNQYAPWIQRLADRKTRGDLAELKKRHPELYKPHPLELDFSKAIVAGLKQGKLPDWQVMVWINLQHPDRDEKQVKLMQALQASPVWSALPFEVRYAARQWFGKAAMTPGQVAWVEAADPASVNQELRELTTEADSGTIAAALGAVAQKVRKSPVFVGDILLPRLVEMPDAAWRDPAVLEGLLVFVDALRVEPQQYHLGEKLLKQLVMQPDAVTVQRASAYLWRAAALRDRGIMYRILHDLAETMLQDQPAVAAALARTGLYVFGNARSAYGFDNATAIAPLKSIDVKASMKLGLMTIPVPRTDPAYPVYESQMAWMSGNEDTAWRLCEAHWEALFPVHRDLAVDYLMWVLRRTIYSRDEARQEQLIKTLQAWAGEESSTLSRERKVEIELAYGDIAVQRGMLKEAHEIFKRTGENKAYDGLLVQYEATLRKARVERMAKDFDGALNTLNELAMEKVPEIWSPVRYAMAEVYYDMEEFDDANDQISAILNREADHSDAKIMQGRLQLKRKKLMEATEVELGTVSSQQTLVPGEKLKVTLTDPTLAVSGAGTEVEVVVWATSGDRERFFLRQFGDQKTKFRGEVATALGAPAPDDRVLQVIGDDEIYYAYSERFRTKMNNMEEKRGGPITVASDALLMASGRRLLSEAEQRVADMEAQMEALKASAAAIRARQAGAVDEQLLSGNDAVGDDLEAPVETRLKPGNPVHVRVIDPDRSRTAQIDALPVSISTSSGDSVGRVILKETGTHTGWFEGQIPTAGAQAMAYAPNSEPGRNPNMVISPKSDYPPWQPVANTGVIPEFRVDLNDNVPLGGMTIRASEAGAKLKSFVVQTAMNNTLWTTVANFPKNDKAVIRQPWQPSVFTVLAPGREQHYGTQSIFDGYRAYVTHLDTGWMQEANQHQYGNVFAMNVAGPSQALTNTIPTAIKWKRSNRWDHPGVVSRFQAYFHEPAKVTRRFRLKLGKRAEPADKDHKSFVPEFLLVVDGRVLNSKGKALEGEINLKPGMHRLEIWTAGWLDAIGFGRSVELQANLDSRVLRELGLEAAGDASRLDRQAVDALVAVPDRFFDPGTFPAGTLPHRNLPAAVSAGGNGTTFSFTFAPDSKARLIRLVFLDQEGPVPVLNKITLQQPDDKTVLPVKQDFAELNKNDMLEILTGDKVAVRYVDDRFVTKSKQTLERFLDVAFSDARMAFEFFEMRKGRDDNDEPYYERQLRFAHGQRVLLSIVDPDMDVTPAPDTVEVTINAGSRGKKTFTAIEDKDAPGTFRVWIKPVAGAAAADDEIQVDEGGTLSAVYRDAENIDPGVPTDRFASIRHAVYTRPVLQMSHSVVSPIDFKAEQYPPKPVVLNPGFEPLNFVGDNDETPIGLAGRDSVKPLSTAAGTILPRWRIQNQMREADSPPDGGFAAVHGQMLYFEIEAAHLALRMGSVTDVFVQTDAGRAAARAAGGAATAPSAGFDITVPGTMKLTAYMAILPNLPTDWQQTPQIPIYIGGGGLAAPILRGADAQQASARFRCSVPLIAGALPSEGVLELSAKEQYDLGVAKKHGLVVLPEERIHVGFRYTDQAGNEQWLTGKTRVVTHPVLDVLEEDQRTAKTEAFVGENLYLRVVDLGADKTDGSDTVRVWMQAKSGAKLAVDLLEVDTHSGVFKAAVPLTYARRAPLPADYDALRDGFPVVYGDLMGCLYADASGQRTPPVPVTIRKGADGDVTPFSKQYDDPAIAMKTQFALAEAYLEMAKNHRARGEEDEAVREYDQARRLLASVVDQFREPETRAHAEYLLGNLTQEEADATEAGELQQERYRAALARFMNVTGTYPDTEHASKAQFKIATIYEKLGEPDIAAQEYVKLAYKYPQSEFLAMAMARLGTHFLRKASGYEKQAAVLLAQTDNKDALFEGSAMQKMAVKEYLNAGSIFARLLRRFPSHELAGQGGLRAGQAYMRAEATRQALQLFLTVVDTDSYDGPDVRAQAMYWAGMCYESLREPMAAYAIYKRLTYDFPESKWAAYARGQLSQDRMLTLETDLEMKRLEEEGK